MITEAQFLPFHVPDIGDEEISEVSDTLRKGWLTTGEKTKRFEAQFAEYLGDGVESLAVNSATSGLHLALEAAGVGSRDEVITSVFTFTATAEVIRYLGAHPVFVDIRSDTLNLDPLLVRRAVTEKTKAIVPVHFAGLACDMADILNVAKESRLRVVEDAAHALPATAAGAPIGTLESDATVFSFYATKTLATGEGGMIATRDAELAARCRTMRLHGIDRDAFDRYSSQTPAWYYQVVAPGFKYNMTDVAASLGIHQLRKVDAMRDRREALARRYDEAFADLPVRLPSHAPEGDVHAWHLYVLRLCDSAPLGRDEFIAKMAEAGIGTSVHFIPLHLHPYWRDTYGLRPTDFPVATDAFNRVVSLPLFPRMTESEQARVIDATRKLLDRA
jgi:dTDP-4-amino-4,6-dideoxygalactose transaminase